jgi:hypothetical protein
MGHRREHMLTAVNSRLHGTQIRMAQIRSDVSESLADGQPLSSSVSRVATLAVLGAASAFYDRAGELLTPEPRLREREEVHQSIQQSIGRVGLNG